jgi:hypothetical protein
MRRTVLFAIPLCAIVLVAFYIAHAAGTKYRFDLIELQRVETN